VNADAKLTVEAMRAKSWECVRLAPRHKTPIGRRWTVTKDVNEVAVWFESGFNVGLVCHERTGVAVLDPDDLLLWADMIDTLGQPCLPWVITGSGKLHYYMRWEPDLPAKLTWQGQMLGGFSAAPASNRWCSPARSIRAAGRTDGSQRPGRDSVSRLIPSAHCRNSPDSGGPTCAITRMSRAGTDLDRLEAAALQQPGAVRRHHGIKFQCPACAAAGHDQHRDNACLFTAGNWGCAWAKDTGEGRAHWDAIGHALGVLTRPWLRGAPPITGIGSRRS
jgi:hypothetical protein